MCVLLANINLFTAGHIFAVQRFLFPSTSQMFLRFFFDFSFIFIITKFASISGCLARELYRSKSKILLSFKINWIFWRILWIFSEQFVVDYLKKNIWPVHWWQFKRVFNLDFLVFWKSKDGPQLLLGVTSYYKSAVLRIYL